MLSVSFFYGGYYFGKRGYEIDIKKTPLEVEIINKNTVPSEVDFGLFWDVWTTLETKYLLRPVNAQEMVWGAIEGMVKAVGDPYTSFLPPEVNEAVKSAINGEYQGIGAELGLKENQLIVVAPLDGSPAKASGVKAGDEILEIEGTSTAGISVTEAVSKIRGDAGTLISLTLRRDGGDPFIVQIRRGVITVESVTWEDKGDGTAYIRISRFGGETNEDWSKVASEVNVDMNELDAIVLDLRGNPGGYMDSAVFIAGEFVKGREVVLFQEDALGNSVPHYTNRLGAFERIPAVFILIDEGSASASEILAAALKHHINATLVGAKSFGKGTIQDAQNFSDGSGLHITIAKWLTPEKVWIHDKGLEPDIPVEITEDAIADGFDAQLEEALKLAKEI